MPHSPLITTGLQDVLANHRLYQLRNGRRAPSVPSLTDCAAQVLATQPLDLLIDVPSHFLADHLRARVAYYAPSRALMCPIREAVHSGFPPWPQALQKRHADIYVAGLCGYTSELGTALHPDARDAQGWSGELLRPLPLGTAAEMHVAQIDVGRLLLGATTREQAAKNKVWRRVIRYASTRHGPLAPPPRPTRVEYEFRYRSHMVLSSLTQLWGHLIGEYLEADQSYLSKALPPYTAALCRGAWLATYWDYDLLRASVTHEIDGTTHRAPSSSLRALRRVLTDAVYHPETTPAAHDDLVKLNQYLGVFDVRLTSPIAAEQSWHRAGLHYDFSKLSFSLKQAERALSSPQKKHSDVFTMASLTQAHALIGLWTDSMMLRSPVPQARSLNS